MAAPAAILLGATAAVTLLGTAAAPILLGGAPAATLEAVPVATLLAASTAGTLLGAVLAAPNLACWGLAAAALAVASLALAVLGLVAFETAAVAEGPSSLGLFRPVLPPLPTLPALPRAAAAAPLRVPASPAISPLRLRLAGAGSRLPEGAEKSSCEGSDAGSSGVKCCQRERERLGGGVFTPAPRPRPLAAPGTGRTVCAGDFVRQRGESPWPATASKRGDRFWGSTNNSS